MLSFYTPWKQQETFGFLTFSGGLKIDQWYETCLSIELYYFVFTFQNIWNKQMPNKPLQTGTLPHDVKKTPSPNSSMLQRRYLAYNY